MLVQKEKSSQFSITVNVGQKNAELKHSFIPLLYCSGERRAIQQNWTIHQHQYQHQGFRGAAELSFLWQSEDPESFSDMELQELTGGKTDSR